MLMDKPPCVGVFLPARISLGLLFFDRAVERHDIPLVVGGVSIETTSLTYSRTVPPPMPASGSVGRSRRRGAFKASHHLWGSGRPHPHPRFRTKGSSRSSRECEIALRQIDPTEYHVPRVHRTDDRLDGRQSFWTQICILYYAGHVHIFQTMSSRLTWEESAPP